MELLQRPPDRLDVRRGHRPVGVGHVDPEADALGEPLELADVALHRRPAQGVELRDPVGLDVALAGGTDLLLDLDLHRQAVAIPAAFAAHEVARHRLVARVDVLERARLDVMDARLTVGGGWPLIEEPRGRVGASLERAREDVGLPPPREDALFERGERDLGVDRLIRHRGLRLLTRPRCEDEAGAPRYHLACRPCRRGRSSVACRDPVATGPSRPAALTGGSRLRLLRERTVRARLGQGLGEDVHRDRGAGFHHPGSLVPRRSRVLVPVDADAAMLHPPSGPGAAPGRAPEVFHGKRCSAGCDMSHRSAAKPVLLSFADHGGRETDDAGDR